VRHGADDTLGGLGTRPPLRAVQGGNPIYGGVDADRSRVANVPRGSGSSSGDR
jgi:hypothetical protein